MKQACFYKTKSLHEKKQEYQIPVQNKNMQVSPFKQYWHLTKCTLILIAAIISNQSLFAFSGGNGTVGSPFQVATISDLNEIRSYPDINTLYFIQTANIDLSSVSDWQAIFGVDGMSTFAGTYDGNGKVIKNLTQIIDDSDPFGGLFGAVSGTIKNLGVININITGVYTGSNFSYIGGLAAGTVDGSSIVTIQNCYTTGSINFQNNNNGTCYVGGLIGDIVNSGSPGVISNCYSHCSITVSGNANKSVGGFIGSIDYNLGSSIQYCYSAGAINVSGNNSYLGGFCGPNAGVTISDCYYDQTTSGLSDTGKGTPKTTAQMQTSTPYSGSWTSANWSFVNGSYPKLVWQTPVIQASAINSSSVTTTGMTVGWTNGDGSRRAVFMKEGTGTITNPSNSTTYTASNNWLSKGTQLGSSGYYCVYNGTGSSVGVSNLAIGTTYTVQIFEYDGVNGVEKYLTTTATNNPNTKATLNTISSITRSSSATTNASSVSWTVTFAASVTGLTASNFSLANTGLTSPSITGVTGSGTTWTVTANTGTGDGSLGLNLANSTGTSATFTNTLPFTGEIYTIDKTAPTVSSINRQTPSDATTAATSVVYRITFSKSVKNVAVGNFTLTKTGTANGTIASVSASTGTAIDVTVNSISGVGTLRLDLNSSGTGITDNAGNAITGGYTSGQTYTIDKTAPTVTLSSTASEPTNVSTIPITITFSESVIGFDASDITVTNGSKGTLSSNGASYSINITPSGQGTVTVNIAAGVATDAAGNSNTAATQLSRTFDNIAPTVTLSSTASEPTNVSPIPVTITFSESVTGFDASDITVTNGSKGTLSSSGASYSINITPSGQGTVTVNIAAGVATDAAGNSNTAASQLSRNYVTVPSAPTIGTATAGNTQASIAFTAPASNGGSAITGYTVLSSPGGRIGSGSSSPITVTGLTNGTAYTFTVTATNAVGTSVASAASNSVIPNMTQTITFSNPGVQSFGTAPQLSATASSGLPVVFSTITPDVCSITSGGVLTFLKAGTCTILADQAGNTAYTAAPTVSQTFTVNAVAPGAPTIGAVAPGDTQATVSFTAPAQDGGSPITSYAVTANLGNLVATGAVSPITVTGLTNGTAYAFTVTATNSAGTSAPSSASNSVTPNASQSITFTNPGAQTFGTTPTLTATASSNLAVTFSTSTPDVCSITSSGTLTFIKAGTCTILADQTGNATYTAASTVSRTFDVNAVSTNAPIIGIATAGDTQATVSFTAPTFTGGSTITGYTVSSSLGGFTATGTASPITVTGLINGTVYTFTVTATNSAGTSAPSSASNSVIPNASQSITFTNPGAQTFGTTPTLTATASSSLAVTFSTSTPDVCTITSGGTLTFIKAGTCTILANQAGNAAYTAAPTVSQTFTVNAVVPEVPTIGTATAGDTQATVSFTAPTFTGGSTITGYTVTASPGGVTATGTASPITVTGLTNGTAYTFTVTATNSAGASAPSTASNSVTPNASQSITFTNPGVQTFGTTPTLTATASSSLAVTFSTSTPDVCTITSSGTLTFIKAGTCTILADQAGNAAYTAAPTVSQTFTVNAVAPERPTIATAIAGDTQATVSFTAPIFTGGSDVTGYTVTSSPGSLTATGTASPITVTGLTNGTAYTFTVTATNNAGISAPSTASNSVTPNMNQSITFNAQPTKTYGDATFDLVATSTSGLAVSYNSDNTAVATVSGSTVTIVGAGTANITASQAGNATYIAAANVIQQLIVNKKTLSVTAATDTKTYDGTTVSTVIPTVGVLITGDAIDTAPTQAFDNAAIGTTHVLTASGLTIKNGSADVTGNYDISYATATGSVTAKPLTITAPTVTLSKVYDGNAVAAVTAGLLSGVVVSDAGNVTATAVASYDNATIGTNKTITVVYTLGGNAAGNYSAPADYLATGAEISSGTIALEPLSNPTSNPTNNDLVLSYTVVTGGPTQYKITFEAAALAVGIQNVSYTALATTSADGSICITVPEGTRPGKYKGTLQLRNDSGVESTAYDFVITVNIPTEYIVVKYNRVLVLDNSTKMFSAYQWYKDGVAIEGATQQFYSDPKGLVGTYTMQGTTTDGEILYSFPKVLNIPLTQKVTAYPSLVRANQTCTVEITDGATELDLTGAELSVYSSQGIRVYYSNRVEKLNSIKLPTMDGMYSGRLTTADGQSFLFKVIMAN